MSKNIVIWLLAAILLETVSLADAQKLPKVPRVGYVFSFTPSEGRHLWEACQQGLRELGYVENRNIILEPRWAEGQYERLPGLLEDLLRLKVDVIVVAATPGNLAAKAASPVGENLNDVVTGRPTFLIAAEVVPIDQVDRAGFPGGQHQVWLRAGLIWKQQSAA